MSEIRVRNDTGHDLDTVRVSPAGGDQHELGPLPAGAVSAWRSVASVRRFPSVDASGEDVDLVHRPLETHGEGLPDGRYTYFLRIEGGRLVVGLES